MFFQYRSNSLLQLSRTFSTHISARKSEHPFRKKWVVVQNKETQQWLTLQVANNLGVAANFEFILPSELIWKVYRTFYPETPKILSGDRIPLQWIIFEFLTDTDPEVFQKIKGFPLINDDMQAFRLSEQLADVFDLYQVYRPEMTEAWKIGSLSTKNVQEYWQLWIWREIQNKVIRKGKVTDRGFVFGHLLNEIKRAPVNDENLPNEIYCFGLSQFSYPFAKLISELSRKIDINYYNTKLKPESNDLFSARWKSLAEDWGEPRFNSEKMISELLENGEIKVISDEKGATENIYSKIQNEEGDDLSIKISSCHSPRREVEVIKDRLLKRLDSDPELNPQDILIMVPDMKEYASLIQSVFHPEDEESGIPVYVPGLYTKPDLLAFSKLLELINNVIKANDFIDFIELEAIRERYSLTEDDLGIIRSWIYRNNTFWGLNEKDSSFSLKKLLKALISGYVTEPEGYDSFEDFVPFDAISTSDQFELTAKLASLINQLIDFRENLSTSRTPEIWIDYFRETTLSLINPDASFLTSTLDKLKDACFVSAISKKVGFSLIYQWILGQLNEIQATSSGFGHGVVVSSYIPYRGIPFKEVAILGMNESVFPRNPDRPVFDLIHLDPKPGDRITKEDDALLFLEILNSTTGHLYLSFIGQDLYSENEKLPSVLLQKLMDVVAESGNELSVQKEKLHGFNALYFEHGESYSTQMQKIALQVYSNTKSEPVFFDLDDFERKKETSTIHINDLIDFCIHPNKYLIQQILSISDGYREAEVSDRELFTMDGLSTWLVNNKLLEVYEHGLEDTKAFEYLAKTAALPGGIPGEKVFKIQSLEVKEFLDQLEDYRSSEPEIIQCSTFVEDVELIGNIGGVVNGRRVIWRMGRSRATDLARLWIEHLLLANQSIDFKETLFITNEKGTIQRLRFEYPENPYSLLTDVINWFRKFKDGKDSLAFFVNSSFAYSQKIIEGKGEDEALKSAQKEWTSTERSNGEDNDFYINLIWKGEEPIQSAVFKKQALMFWKPVLEHVTESK
ncbi:MAG: exodeoxyribonuclease V subunit gamma [Balneolaceae bacterium]|nr:exodeoxyribonuclease V subunit gamma [Balneolaceae bacterium]MBO6546142.1 exodeoxyribonuclease V subunit gamma [Balneolaceae bacterium]MBO6648500.1 exodeoxyribonuclease V subunit gamma [Balneolaceae bacterium]